MDNDAEQRGSLDESSVLQTRSPYVSEDSRFSENSCVNQDDMIGVNLFDNWEENSCRDTSDHYQNHSYESLPLAITLVEGTSFVQSTGLCTTVEPSNDPLEENNNDPNNNMDSNMIPICDESRRARDRRLDHEMDIYQSNSPRSSCSRIFLPHSTANEIPWGNEAILARTRQVLSLLSTIQHDSVFAAIARNYDVSMGNLKLVDLVPEKVRFKYLTSSAVHSAPICTSTAKRSHAEDICNVGYKKSSNSGTGILLPKLQAVSKASKISEISVPAFNHISTIAEMRCKDSGPGEASLKKYSRKKKARHSKKSLEAANSTHSVAAQPVMAKPANTQNLPATGAIFIDRSKGAIPKVAGVVTTMQSNIAAHSAGDSIAKVPTATNVHTDVDQKRIPVTASQTAAMAVVPDVNLTSAEGNAPMQGLQTSSQELSASKPVCMEMYYKLRNIFPNVNADFLKSLCPSEWGPGDRDEQFAPIVEYLLAEGDNLPVAPIQSTDTVQPAGLVYGNVDDIYENLLGIFPDADPHYLRDFATKNVSKPDTIKEFVELKLEARDYPTREQYKARLKITEQQRQYTTGFNVRQYLTIIPDPFNHFLNASRKCTYSTVALEFLKSYFSKIRATTIATEYAQCTYNLSSTANVLELITCDMHSKRRSIEIPTEDILLLQEIAFVKHKAAISEHIANVKRTEETEFRIMKEQNFLVECQCCFDSECVPSKCSSCDNGHLFCNNCVIAGTNTKLGEGETRINCFVNCDSEISLPVLQRVLAPTTFSILLQKRQAAEVMEAGLEGLVSCPFCNFSSIPPEGDKIFKCLNPECTKESCRLCKKLSHVPLKCDEVLRADRARHYIEERMTEALARKCYKCQRAFFKEEGCNKIQCPCGAMMCYLCDQPITNYSHFRENNSNGTNLCSLYSDNMRLNAVAVHRVAEEAQMQIMKKNPNITIDTTKLLPTIPQAARGPYGAQLDMDGLERRAQRIVEHNQL